MITATIIVLMLSTFLPSSSPATFRCTGDITICEAMIGYTTVNSTTYASIKDLFQTKFLGSLFQANNLSTTTDPSKTIPANTTLRIPFPCSCSNGTGASSALPIYTMYHGEGLNHIATDVFGSFVTYQEIAAANDIKNPNIVLLKRVWIPLPCSCDAVDGVKAMHYAHKVAEGSTLSEIADYFGISVEKLMRVNKITVPSSLEADQILDVPLAIPPTPPSVGNSTGAPPPPGSGSTPPPPGSSSSSTPPPPERKRGLVVGVSVGVGLVVALCAVAALVLLVKRRLRQTDPPTPAGPNWTGTREFSFRELEAATANFNDVLGEGGFGTVYRGDLVDLPGGVAVKRIASNSNQGRREYEYEIKTIGQLRHKNLVRLQGWCHERNELLLVYDFMSNGSLDRHLFNMRETNSQQLTWPLRYKIARGLASALHYLHEAWDSINAIVHRDIKCANVMLDGHYEAKLGDFGLARFVDHERSLQTTWTAGTMGYMAPELLRGQKASVKSDVYSFGVVALEIACGRRVIQPEEEAGKVSLVEWMWGLYRDVNGQQGLLLQAADERLNGKFDQQEMERLMVVGLWCAHPEAESRPRAGLVLDLLFGKGDLPRSLGQPRIPSIVELVKTGKAMQTPSATPSTASAPSSPSNALLHEELQCRSR